MEHTLDVDPRVDAVIRRLEKIKSLPTLPSVAMEVISLAKDSRSSMRQIEEVIQTDPSLATKILKVANSPFYGMRREISSLRLALTVLGMNQIRSLIISVSVFKALGKGTEKGFDYEALWEHSIGAAVLCRLLARRFGLSFDGEEYVAGLVHDIGKVILDQFLHEEFTQALAAARENSESLEEAERRIIGVDHAFAGCWLAGKWGLPASLAQAIGDHHSPPAGAAPSMAAVVNFADAVARIGAIGDSINPRQPRLESLQGWRIACASARAETRREFGGRETAGEEETINPDEFIRGIATDIESARNFAQII